MISFSASADKRPPSVRCDFARLRRTTNSINNANMNDHELARDLSARWDALLRTMHPPFRTITTTTTLIEALCDKRWMPPALWSLTPLGFGNSDHEPGECVACRQKWSGDALLLTQIITAELVVPGHTFVAGACTPCGREPRALATEMALALGFAPGSLTLTPTRGRA